MRLFYDERVTRPSTSDRRTIAAIDWLRLVCALLVMSYHYGFAFTAPTAPSPLAVLALPAGGRWWSGWIGVEIFFVISGYVIFASADGSGAGRFTRARALRLVPAAWLCATTTAAILLVEPVPSVVTIWTAWLHAMTFNPFGVQLDGSYWTLAVEIAFYLFVAAALLMGASGDRLLRVILLLGAASIDYWTMQAAFAEGIPSPTRAGMLTLMPHGAFFALGALLRALNDGHRMTWRTAVFVAALTGACCFEIAVRAAQVAHDYRMSATPTVPILLFCCAVLLIASAQRLQSTIARAAFARRAAIAGLATYPLYLIHQSAGAVIIAALLHRGLHYAAAALLTAALALGFGVACALYAEPWLRDRLRRIRPIRGLAPDSPRIASPPAG